MPYSRRTGVNLSGLIDQQTNFINATSQFNAVYSTFNIKLMNFRVKRFKRARNVNDEQLGWYSVVIHSD